MDKLLLYCYKIKQWICKSRVVPVIACLSEKLRTSDKGTISHL